MLKQYKCLIHTTSGARGKIIERNDEDQRVTQLLDRKIIVEYSDAMRDMDEALAIAKTEEVETKPAPKPKNKAKKAK